MMQVSSVHKHAAVITTIHQGSNKKLADVMTQVSSCLKHKEAGTPTLRIRTAVTAGLVLEVFADEMEVYFDQGLCPGRCSV